MLLINNFSRKNESSYQNGRRSFALKTTVCNKVVYGHRLLEVLSPTIGKRDLLIFSNLLN